MKIRFKKLHPDAILPVRKTEFAAGYDLHVVEYARRPLGKMSRLGTGIAVEIPPGWVGLIRPRSSAFEHIIIDGTIDSDYRGEVMIQVLPHITSSFIYDTAYPFSPAVRMRDSRMITITAGERIAQLVIVPCLQAESEWADELIETMRGSGGFGSTGRS